MRLFNKNKIFIFFLIFNLIIISISCGESNDKIEVSEEIFERGVTSDEILIGMSAALDFDEGRMLHYGALAYFKHINENGGIGGKKIKLIAYNDNYKPETLLSNTLRLINNDRVFALFNYLSNNTINILSTIESYKIPLIGVASGLETFRETHNKYIFNVRASYKQEIETMLKYYIEGMNFKNIAILYQDEGFSGEIFRNVAEDILKKYNLEPSIVVPFYPDEHSIKLSTNRLLEYDSDAVLVFGTNILTAYLINYIKNEISETIEDNDEDGNNNQNSKNLNQDLYFSCLSIGFSTADSILLFGDTEEKLENIFITQAIPNLWEYNLEVLVRAREILRRYYPDETINYYIMEGFFNAVTLVALLERTLTTNNKLTIENFINTINNTRNLNIGGITINYYGENNNQGMRGAFITKITNGIFETINF